MSYTTLSLLLHYYIILEFLILVTKCLTGILIHFRQYQNLHKSVNNNACEPILMHVYRVKLAEVKTQLKEELLNVHIQISHICGVAFCDS